MIDHTALPAGLVTFMFTDIVGSTDMKGSMPGVTTAERQDAFLQQVKAPHEAIIKELERPKAASDVRSHPSETDDA